jgi:hypothetical protein
VITPMAYAGLRGGVITPGHRYPPPRGHGGGINTGPIRLGDWAHTQVAQEVAGAHDVLVLQWTYGVLEVLTDFGTTSNAAIGAAVTQAINSSGYLYQAGSTAVVEGPSGARYVCAIAVVNSAGDGLPYSQILQSLDGIGDFGSQLDLVGASYGDTTDNPGQIAAQMAQGDTGTLQQVGVVAGQTVGQAAQAAGNVAGSAAGGLVSGAGTGINNNAPGATNWGAWLIAGVLGVAALGALGVLKEIKRFV